MSKLDCKPEVLIPGADEEPHVVPAAGSTAASQVGTGFAPGARGLRRRFSATRLQVGDDGFRLFRVY